MRDAERIAALLQHGLLRASFIPDRPLLLGNPRAQWIRLMEARRPVYEGLATATVDTWNKNEQFKP